MDRMWFMQYFYTSILKLDTMLDILKKNRKSRNRQCRLIGTVHVENTDSRPEYWMCGRHIAQPPSIFHVLRTDLISAL